jgi:hypothetical protein
MKASSILVKKKCEPDLISLWIRNKSNNRFEIGSSKDKNAKIPTVALK